MDQLNFQFQEETIDKRTFCYAIAPSNLVSVKEGSIGDTKTSTGAFLNDLTKDKRFFYVVSFIKYNMFLYNCALMIEVFDETSCAPVFNEISLFSKEDVCSFVNSVFTMFDNKDVNIFWHHEVADTYTLELKLGLWIKDIRQTIFSSIK